MTIETADNPADTGYDWDDHRIVERAGPPFNYPTGIALAPEGDLYVSDGYGNARVHKFTVDGDLLFSWGEPGEGNSQFETPHNVCVDREGTVYVADRQNRRMQIFNARGEFITQWDDMWWPCDMCIDADDKMYVAEVGGILHGRDQGAGTRQSASPHHGARSERQDSERVGDGGSAGRWPLLQPAQYRLRFARRPLCG